MATPKSRAAKTLARSDKPSATRRRSHATGGERVSPTRRTRSVLELANDILEHPGAWLETPNPQLGDREPISLIGNLAGTKTELLLTHVFMQQIRLQGILVGSRESFEAMNRAIALNGLKPVIDRAFPLEDAPAAFLAMAAGGHFGKIVVKV